MRTSTINSVNNSDYKNQLQTFLNQQGKEADHAVRYFIIGFFLFGVAIVGYYDTWLFAFGIGGFCLAAYFVCAMLISGTLLSRLIISLLFAVYMLQFIGQMHGMYEMHFFFFINIAILIIYQDWRIMVPYTAVAITHHSVFFYFQLMGYDTGKYFISNAVDMRILGFHFGLVALMGVVCGWWAMILRRRTVTDFNNQLSLKQQLTNVQHNLTFAQQISAGNLQVTYQAATTDELSKALLQMQEGLLKASWKEEQERFHNVGIAQISEILRDHTTNINDLSARLIKKLVNYVGANQGGLFITEGEGNEQRLMLHGCYAYDRTKYLKKEIYVGEGLLGQLLLEKATLYLTDIPANYLSITSGLGGANPKSLLLIPLQTNGQIVGAIELASFEDMPAYKIEFLEKISDSMAATFAASQINEHTNKLLKEFQVANEYIRTQEEEMRQNMEELQATQEETQRRMQEYEELLQEKNALIGRLKNQTLEAIDSAVSA